MFEIDRTAPDSARLRGRFDAAQEERARAVLEDLQGPATLDFTELAYISSVGLGLLLALRRRLAGEQSVILVGVHPHIRELLALSGIDQYFVVR